MNDYLAPETKGTIVVIDDDIHILDLVKIILERRGYSVFTAFDAESGLSLITEKNPEVVILDYMMPKVSGLDVLKDIRHNFSDIAVVMFTGRGNEELAVTIMKNGAKEYIVKPFNNQNFLERIENVFKIRSIELHNKELQVERLRLIDKIESWNIELQKRVQEKTDALHNAQKEIAQSEKIAALGYLTAGMAHEIRNPLNSISLFIQLLKQLSNDSEQHKYQDKILKEVDRIDTIIRNLLDASKRTRSIRNDINLTDVIKGVAENFAPQSETKKIEISINTPDTTPIVKGDIFEIEQIFTNLILNAMDEIRTDGKIEIVVENSEDKVFAKVKDSGKGIRTDIIDKIFDPFVSTKDGGSGMGLPVVKRIINLLNGDITIESTSSAGTVFKLEFPAV